MRQFLIMLVALSIALRTSAQIETYKLKPNIWNTSHDFNLAIYKPVGYADSVGKVWPTIIYLHGNGDGGTDVSKITNNYVFGLIRQGKGPKGFIVLAPQANTSNGSTWPPNLDFALDYALKTAKLRIDTNRIYTMGHSYGGDAALIAAMYDSLHPKRIAAVASLSPHPNYERFQGNAKYLVRDSVPIWFYTGTEAKESFTAPVLKFNSYFKSIGGNSHVQIFNGGHDGGFWVRFYEGLEKIVYNGKSVNVYDWFILHSKAKKAPPIAEPPPPTDTSFIVLPYDWKRVEKIIILDKDGTWTEYNDSTIHSGPLKIQMR